MINKKRVLSVFGFCLIGLVVLGIFASNFVSAYYFPSLRGISQSMIDGYVSTFEPILQALFGGPGGWTGYLLFERFLFFILLALIIYLAIGKFPLFENKKIIRWIISLIIPLISIRYIDYNSLLGIISHYKILGIIITSILPIIIFFYFLYSSGEDFSYLRKLGWALFIVLYLGLWSTTLDETSSQVYFWTVFVAVFCLISDGAIARQFKIKSLNDAEKLNLEMRLGTLNTQINTINEQMETGALSMSAGRRRVKQLEQQKKWIVDSL